MKAFWGLCSHTVLSHLFFVNLALCVVVLLYLFNVCDFISLFTFSNHKDKLIQCSVLVFVTHPLSLQAECVYAGPGNASCVCAEGWTGDGRVCVEINNCLLESRGSCSTNADCKHIGPGQVGA